MTQRPTLSDWLRRPVDVPLRIALRVATVPIWLAASIALAILMLFVPLPLPNLLGALIFMAPQYLFAFGQVVRPAESGFGSVPFFADGTAGYACAALWLTVTIGHAAITRRWKLSHAFAMGLVAVLVTAVLVHLAFFAFGYVLRLDWI